MTNFEKYKSEVLNLLINFSVHKRTGRIRVCTLTNCTDCLFGGTGFSCSAERLKWLYNEYEEPTVDWSKVPIDTKVLVSDNGEEWCKRHFAGVDSDDGKPTVYIHGMTSWSAGDTTNWVKYIFTKLVEEKNYD